MLKRVKERLIDNPQMGARALRMRHRCPNKEQLQTEGQKVRSRNPSHVYPTSYSNLIADLEWPPHEEEFVITLDEDGWNLGSVQGYKVDADEIEVQLLEPLKTRAKDDQGKTY